MYIVLTLLCKMQTFLFFADWQHTAMLCMNEWCLTACRQPPLYIIFALLVKVYAKKLM